MFWGFLTLFAYWILIVAPFYYSGAHKKQLTYSETCYVNKTCGKMVSLGTFLLGVFYVVFLFQKIDYSNYISVLIIIWGSLYLSLSGIISVEINGRLHEAFAYVSFPLMIGGAIFYEANQLSTYAFEDIGLVLVVANAIGSVLYLCRKDAMKAELWSGVFQTSWMLVIMWS